MKLHQLFEAPKKRGKAGCIPYVLEANGEPRMAFMISSDAAYGGPDPMIAKGGIDPGETEEVAGVREAEEELGLRRSNIVDGTLTTGWTGELEGLDAKYPFTVMICRVDDVRDFGKPHYETKEVVWFTEAEFNKKGRRSQRHIVSACAEKIRKLAQ